MAHGTPKTRWDFPDEVHYRLYRSPRDEEPTVICVQWFDYPDYSEDRFLSEEAFDYEDDAKRALEALGGGEVPMLRAVAEEFEHRDINAKYRGDYADDQVHYRLYLSPRFDDVVVICVQDFDYWDYEAWRFISDAAFDTEEQAQERLDAVRSETYIRMS